MAGIELLLVENSLSRRKNAHQQLLEFLLVVDSDDHHKQVDVIWSGSDGIWHTLQASYQGPRGNGRETWLARTRISSKSARKLPGDISFALRLRSHGDEFWDNNQSWNYHSRKGSGISLEGDLPLQNLTFKPHLEANQQFMQVTLAMDAAQQAESVVVHWTTDNWRNVQQTVCRRNKKQKASGAQLWTARLKVSNVFALEYCICCQTHYRSYWDNNAGLNYRITHPPLRVMILNLHCYQEQRQDAKLSLIAKAIEEQAVDVVCFQEVAEHWNDGHGDWPSNAANIINQRLKQSMHLYSDWSHLGFDKYREGVAILSRFPLHNSQSRYVSDSQDAYSIHSRKVVMAQIQVPFMGAINVFSAHLSWWEDGFRLQFQRLCEWANEQLSESVKTNLLCGDFNIAAGSLGYQQVVNSQQYEDQYLAANQQGLFEQIFRVNDAHWGQLLSDDYRIDYIFMNNDSDLRVTSARVIFTDWDYGRVSDHCGYLMVFEPK